MAAWDEGNVRHLLSRAGFGAKPREIQGYVRRGQLATVEQMVAASPVGAKGPGTSEQDPGELAKLREWWIRRMAKQSSRRLQEKMVLFWHDHFATQYSVVKNVRQMSYQNRTFRLFGLDDFKTLVHQVTRDAAMLDFLDGRANRANNLNENYGRELMELFVLGVRDMSGNENYTQADVQAMARSLTGYQIDAASDLGVFNPGRFDNGTKTLFTGKPYKASGNLGVEDASGLLPPERNIIDILFSHTDSDGKITMARFLGKKLWEYFAYPNPSKARVDEITEDFIAGGFVIRDLLRSLFLHEDFYSEQAKTSTVKNPCEFAIGALRAFEARSNYQQVHDFLSEMGMDLFEPPSVNGWSNGLPWLSSGQFLARWDFNQALAAGRDPRDPLKLTMRRLIDSSATTAAAVVDGLLARIGIASRVPSGARQALIDYIDDWPNPLDFSDDALVDTKVRGVIALMLDLPEAQIH